MKKSNFWVFAVSLLLAGLVVYFTYSIASWRYDSKKNEPASALVTPSVEASPVDDFIVTDYVCGKSLDKRACKIKEKYLDYDFYFCSEECKLKFAKEPLKYLPLKIKIKLKPGASPETSGEATPLPEITLEDLHPSATPTFTSTVDQGYPEDTIEVIPEDGGGTKPVPTETVENQY